MSIKVYEVRVSIVHPLDRTLGRAFVEATDITLFLGEKWRRVRVVGNLVEAGEGGRLVSKYRLIECVEGDEDE